MRELIAVGEFIEETREDYSSPTTSTFATRVPQFRKTINVFEETLDSDREGLAKLKKAVKAINNSGNSHVDNELYFAKALEKLGSTAISKEEPDIGAAFLKFSVVTKELSALMRTLMQHLNNIIMFPVDSLLKSELKGVKGDMKRPFEKAAKDYDSKYLKIEKDKKSQAKEVGMVRSEVSPSEVADEMEKERRLFQLQMCEYLIKFNEIKTKKEIELLQHLIEYYHAQNNYFKDGLKTIAYFGSYIEDLSSKLQLIKQKQDDERKKLLDLRTLLRSSSDIVKIESVAEKRATLSLHNPLQGDRAAGTTKSGYIYKKSGGKVRKVWQKRKCRITDDGFLEIFHADEAEIPTRVNILTCQIKPVPDEKKAFDLISYNRPYHFQAEDEKDAQTWISVLINCKEQALKRTFQYSARRLSPSLIELQKTVIAYIRNTPGNDVCCDCGSRNDVTWVSTNIGALVCIQCSGVHRDLGVQHSRIQSLTLDNLTTAQLLITGAVGNMTLNEVLEATVGTAKITPDTSIEERYDFIRAKYVAKRYIMRTCANDSELRSDLEQAIVNGDISQLLQVWAEGVDLSCVLPSSEYGETSLHLAVLRDGAIMLPIVDFLIQHMPSKGLTKQTYGSSTGLGAKMTALHLCALYDKKECTKLLLRANANADLRNAANQTPLDIAADKGHGECKALLEQAQRKDKGVFDHIDTSWNLHQDDAFTDFSDDDFGPIVRSRPSSFAGGDSPVTTRSRSSTYDSMQSDLSLKPVAANAAAAGTHCGISPKHRTPASSEHSFSGSAGGGGKRYDDAWKVNSLKKQQAPPPPLPDHKPDNYNSLPTKAKAAYFEERLSEHSSTLQHRADKYQNSGGGGVAHAKSNRVAVGDAVGGAKADQASTSTTAAKPKNLKRCRALYDCTADNHDELEFKEGEILIILNERTDDENWMEGEVEGDCSRKGMFPTSYVVMLPN